MPAPSSTGTTRTGNLEMADIVGLWHGIATISTPNIEINAGGRGDDEYSVPSRSGAQYDHFLPDGSYSNDIPDFGIDASTLRRGSVDGRGNYRVDGNAVTMKSLAPGATQRTLRIFNGLLQTPEGTLKRRPDTHGIALEVGTVPILERIEALRADQWLENYPEAPKAQRMAIKRQLRDAFYTDTDGWKQTVASQAREAAMQALRGLGAD